MIFDCMVEGWGAWVLLVLLIACIEKACTYFCTNDSKAEK